MYNVPRPDQWDGASLQHLRFCVKPVAGDVVFTRFVDAKDAPQVNEPNRRTSDLSTRIEEDVETWLDLGGKTRTGTAVTIQPIDHDMSFVTAPLALERLLLVMQVGSVNSLKTRWSLVNIVELGAGVIVLVAREPKNVLSKNECFYFLFVCSRRLGFTYLMRARATST